MFTGIVEEMGTVRRVDGGRFEFEARLVIEDAETRRLDRRQRLLPHRRRDRATAGGPPTRSTRRCRAPTSATWRPAIRSTSSGPSGSSDRLGGHIVQGHVDGVGEVEQAAPDLRVRTPRGHDPLRRREGLDHRRRLQPHGRRRPSTTPASPSPSSRTPPRSPSSVGERPGDRVNLEVDLVAKYVERLVLQKEG